MTTYDFAAAAHTSRTDHDGRYVRTVNHTAPDGSGDVEVTGGGGGGGLDTEMPQLGPPVGTATGLGTPLLRWNGHDSVGNQIAAGFDHTVASILATLDVTASLPSTHWNSAWPNGAMASPWSNYTGTFSATSGLVSIGTIGALTLDESLLLGHAIGTDVVSFPCAVAQYDPGVPPAVRVQFESSGTYVPNDTTTLSSFGGVIFGLSGTASAPSGAMVILSSLGGGEFNAALYALNAGVIETTASVNFQANGVDFDGTNSLLLALCGNQVAILQSTDTTSYLVVAILGISRAGITAMGSATNLGLWFGSGITSGAVEVFGTSSDLIARGTAPMGTLQAGGSIAYGISVVDYLGTERLLTGFNNPGVVLQAVNQAGNGGPYSSPLYITAAQASETTLVGSNIGNAGTTLPVKPVGYVTFDLNGTPVAVPYYIP